MFIKKNSIDIASVAMVIHSLNFLRTALIKDKRKTTSVAKKGDGLDNLHWLPIECSLRENWNQHNLVITLCTGEARLPKIGERLGIISEAHDSAIGGHKGITKTFRRIRERIFWQGIKRDIEEYVKTCQECQKGKLVRVKTK